MLRYMCLRTGQYCVGAQHSSTLWRQQLVLLVSAQPPVWLVLLAARDQK